MIRISLIAAILLAVCGCASRTVNDVTDPAVTSESAQYYVDNDIYIGAEIWYDPKASVDVPVVETMTPQAKAKWKAAMYRFFSNTDIVDGLYVCGAGSGKALNMSEKIFRMLQDNLEELNSFITEARAKGLHEPELTVTDEAYLQELLTD